MDRRWGTTALRRPLLLQNHHPLRLLLWLRICGDAAKVLTVRDLLLARDDSCWRVDLRQPAAGAQACFGLAADHRLLATAFGGERAARGRCRRQ